jgi:hypothetical protein
MADVVGFKLLDLATFCHSSASKSGRREANGQSDKITLLLTDLDLHLI